MRSSFPKQCKLQQKISYKMDISSLGFNSKLGIHERLPAASVSMEPSRQRSTLSYETIG